MNSWRRDHIRLPVRIVQTGSTQYHIPSERPRGTWIPVDGSLEEAQRIADALSGCGPLCSCPPWAKLEESDPVARSNALRRFQMFLDR